MNWLEVSPLNPEALAGGAGLTLPRQAWYPGSRTRGTKWPREQNGQLRHDSSHFQSSVWQDPEVLQRVAGIHQRPRPGCKRTSLGSSRIGSCKALQTHLTFLTGGGNLCAWIPGAGGGTELGTLQRFRILQYPCLEHFLILPSRAISADPQVSLLRGRLGRVTLPTSERYQETRPNRGVAHGLHPPPLPCSGLGGLG